MRDFDKVIDACVGKLDKKEPFNNMGWGEIVDYLGLDYHPDNLRKGAYFVKKYNSETKICNCVYVLVIVHSVPVTCQNLYEICFANGFLPCYSTFSYDLSSKC